MINIYSSSIEVIDRYRKAKSRYPKYRLSQPLTSYGGTSPHWVLAVRNWSGVNDLYYMQAMFIHAMNISMAFVLPVRTIDVQ